MDYKFSTNSGREFNKQSMKHLYLVLILSLGINSPIFSQKVKIDSLLNKLSTYSTQDTNKILVLNQLCKYLEKNNPSEAINYGQEALNIAYNLKKKRLEAEALKNIGNVYLIQGNYPQALKEFLKSQSIYDDVKDRLGKATIINKI